jgi:erythromycin esterase-like protein
MQRMNRRAAGACVAGLGAVAWLGIESLTVTARAQTPAGSPVIDEVVSAVCQKRVVLLGELPSHGEALAFDAKSKIAEQLIARCGFTALLFEAPIYDFIGFERAVAARAAAPEQLDDAIGRFWMTRELAAWRRGLFDAATAGKLTIGGIDDQISITSRYAISELPRLVAAATSERSATMCREVVSRHLGYRYDDTNPFDEAEQRRLRTCAQDAAKAADANASASATDRAMLNAFARYCDRQVPGATSSRDESMYRNLAWHLDRLPANSRVIVWTATVHAAKTRGSLADVPLGARAVEALGDRVASVGFTAYSGFTSRAARPATPIAEAAADSLEAVSTRDAGWAVVGDAKLRAFGRVPSRLLGRFVADTWSDYFDVVLVVRQEVAPTFDPWK